MRALALILGLSLAQASAAQQNLPALPELLPPALVTQCLQQDPAVDAAHAEFESAMAEAAQVEASPYEWAASAGYQQRDYGLGPRSHEWNVGLERQVRLPRKANADRAIAEAMTRAAQARYSHARQQASKELLDLWLDSQRAQGRKALLTQQQALAQHNLDIVVKRIRSGDAATLEERLAAAELDALAAELAAAEAELEATWARFASRYQLDELPAHPLPEPQSVAFDADWWQTRRLAVSDELATLQAELSVAEFSAKRADADRIPDPTFGIASGTEAYGEEKLIGGTLTIPFPGERRALQVRQRLAEVDIAGTRIEALRRELSGAARAAYATAVGSYTRWQLARRAAQSMTDTARLTQRAYALGEGDLQTLLLARRQQLAMSETEFNSRVEALRAAYTQALEVKILWQASDTPAD